MIPSSTVKKFLARDLADFRDYKKLTNEQLQQRCERLPVRPPIWAKLSRTQKICFIIGAEQKRFFFQKDMGMGKTVLSIALILYFVRLRHNKRVLVLVPSKINKDEWAREIKKHASDTPYATLKGSSADKWARLERTKGLIVIETYTGLLRMVCKEKLDKRKRPTGKLTWDKSKIRRLMERVDGLVMDESNKAKTREALPFRICRQIVKDSSIVFALSGTPFGRDPTDLWGQMFLVDEGATLGPTLGMFRAAFFNEKVDKWGRVDYEFDDRKMGLLHRTLANGSIRFIAKESDLPRVIPIEKRVQLTDDAFAYYKHGMDALRETNGNYRETKNVFLRLRQISSGFIGYADDDLGIRAEMEFPENPKLDLLLATIDAIRSECKILVFHDFIFSGSMISRELEKEKVKHIRLHHKTKNHAELLKQFDNDPSIRVFILNTAGAYGLNLQKAQYGIFYERPVPVVMYKQMRRRLERQYSEHEKIFLYDLVTENTMDERIIELHNEGVVRFNGIIDRETMDRIIKDFERVQ